MYNRYVPNANGSYDCQRVPSPPPRPSKPGSGAEPRPPKPAPGPQPPKPKPPAPPLKPNKGLPFQLALPEKLDTGDILVLLVLLLVLQEEDEDPLSTLLALGAFLLLQ